MRPVLLTTNANLYPTPIGTVGYDLCKMAECTPDEYVDCFEFCYTQGKSVRRIWEMLEGRHIIVIGNGVLYKPKFKEYILPQVDHTGREWRVIPNLSNSIRSEYNNPMMKLAVSMLLRDWLENHAET